MGGASGSGTPLNLVAKIFSYRTQFFERLTLKSRHITHRNTEDRLQRLNQLDLALFASLRELLAVTIGWHAQRLCDGRGGSLLAEMRKHPGGGAQYHATFATLLTGRLAPNRCY